MTKPKKVKVIANITGKTSDIGDLVKDEGLMLPPELAKLAVDAGVARWPKEAPAKSTKKIKEVEGDVKAE